MIRLKREGQLYREVTWSQDADSESRFKRAGKLSSDVMEFDSLFSFLKKLKYKKHLGAVVGTVWGQERVTCWCNVVVQL